MRNGVVDHKRSCIHFTTANSTVAVAEVYARDRRLPEWPQAKGHHSVPMLRAPADAVAAEVAASAAVAGRMQG